MQSHRVVDFKSDTRELLGWQSFLGREKIICVECPGIPQVEFENFEI